MSEYREASYPRCGEIWMCRLGQRGSGVQSGYRPVLILSNNKNNLFAPTINVAPLTTRMNKRNLPVHVELWDYVSYGLKAPSTVLIEQLTTVSVYDLDYRVGYIEDSKTLESIWSAIVVQFPIMQMVSASISPPIRS